MFWNARSATRTTKVGAVDQRCSICCQNSGEGVLSATAAGVFLDTTVQALAMGAAIGVVLGGSQALSRSLFSRVIPTGQEATFFGLYEISERGTSWIGPQVFAVVLATTAAYVAMVPLVCLREGGGDVEGRTGIDTSRVDASVARAK